MTEGCIRTHDPDGEATRPTGARVPCRQGRHRLSVKVTSFPEPNSPPPHTSEGARKRRPAGAHCLKKKIFSLFSLLFSSLMSQDGNKATVEKEDFVASGVAGLVVTDSKAIKENKGEEWLYSSIAARRKNAQTHITSRGCK